MSEIISSEKLRQLAAEWIGQGIRVAGPQRAGGRVLYLPLKNPADLLLDGFIHPANSAKEFLFPKTETLYSYRVEGHDVKLVEEAGTDAPQVLLAVRPCDAAAFPILDHIFNWDCADDLYNRRRSNTTIVALACSTHDANCFCTSVGLGPASDRGADVLLVPLTSDTFEVRCLYRQGSSAIRGQDHNEQCSGHGSRRSRAAILRRGRAKVFRSQLRASALGRTCSGLRGMRRLCSYLSHLPLLRHCRRAQRARSQLGFVPVQPVYAARQRAQSSS